jgi:hypothetical protein
LVQLSPPLPSVSAAMASSTGLDVITLPVALVATAMANPAAAAQPRTSRGAATARPAARRRSRRHHRTPPRARWRRAPAPATACDRLRPPRPPRPPRRLPAKGCPPPARCARQPLVRRGRRRCAQQPAAAGALCPLRRRAAGRAVAARRPAPRRHRRVRHRVPLCAACVCAHTRLPGTLLPRTVAGRCRGRPGCTRQLAAAGLSPGYLGPVAVLGLGYGPRNAPCSGPSMRHRPLGAATPCARARACRSTRSMRAHARACRWCAR